MLIAMNINSNTLAGATHCSECLIMLLTKTECVFMEV